MKFRAYARATFVFGMFLFAACGSNNLVGTQCRTQQVYAPDTHDSIDLWPDPLFVESDPQSSTGIRLSIEDTRAKWVPRYLTSIKGASGYTGFARVAKMTLRFSRPVESLPNDGDASLTSDKLKLFELGTGEPVRIPYEVKVSDDGKGGVRIAVRSLQTLKAATNYLLVATNELKDASGGCIAQADLISELMAGNAPSGKYTYAAEKYAESLAAAGLSSADVVAAIPFVTHNELANIVAARNHAVKQKYTYVNAPKCVADENRLRCEGTFFANDYRDEGKGYITNGEPKATYEIPFVVWLPTGRSGAYKLMLFGHGLGGNRYQAQNPPTRMQDLDVAVAAIDTLTHGDHPTAKEVNGLGPVEFLGIFQDGKFWDAQRIRGYFNQGLLDRVQLLSLLEQNPDITGDGNPDLQTDRIAYLGISFGGLHGPGTVALNPSIEASVFNVPGGDLSAFVTEFPIINPLVPDDNTILRDLGGVDAILAVAQTIVDPGDPATWAAHVLRDRFVGEVSHLLMFNAEYDQIVAPETGYILARGLQIPAVAPAFTPVFGVPVLSPPFSRNFEGKTVGYVQFDRVNSTAQEFAIHDVGRSPEARKLTAAFWEKWAAGEAPVINDPYEGSAAYVPATE